jgi:hypothetical protein
MLLDAGEAVTVVAARLGHRDTSTTLKVYSPLMPGADTRATEVVGSAFRRREGEQTDRCWPRHPNESSVAWMSAVSRYRSSEL